MNQLSDGAIVNLLCLVGILLIVLGVAVYHLKPEWWERAAGEPMPKNLRPKGRGKRK